MNRITQIIMIAIAVIISFTACEEEESQQMAQINVRMTDAPAIYNQVNVDLEQVRVRLGGGGWLDVTTYDGMYDLLALTNGLDTLIVNDSLPAGQQLTEIRLVLGDSSTIMVDSVLYPLATPSAEDSGLKIKLNRVLVQDSLNMVLLDFDAQLSVVDQGNDTYSLKPVIRVIP